MDFSFEVEFFFKEKHLFIYIYISTCFYFSVPPLRLFHLLIKQFKLLDSTFNIERRVGLGVLGPVV